ncbi:MAG: hypothetical protein ACM3W4_11740 [Ignavibacteriales bacterium]
MMRIIVEEKWKKFRLDDGTWNGRLFESFIRELLHALTGFEWEETACSWDGSKDLTLTFHALEVWAECKMRSREIDRSLLFPTLVMASNAGVASVLFFSYSNITKGAHLSGAQFANSNGIRLRIYADRQLENLVLSKPEICRSHFGFSPTDADSPPLPPILLSRTWQSVEDGKASCEDWDRWPGRDMISLPRRAVFRVDVAPCNRFALKPLRATIQMRDKAAGKRAPYRLIAIQRGRDFIDCFDGRVEVSLEPGETLWFRYFFQLSDRLTKARPSPKFDLVLSEPQPGGVETDSTEALLAPVRGLWVPLTGSPVAFVQRIGEISSGRDRPIFVAVHGASGAGKSRLLTELRAPMLANRYRIVALDGGVSGGPPLAPQPADLSRRSPYADFFSLLLRMLAGFPAALGGLDATELRETALDRNKLVSISELVALIKGGDKNQGYEARVEDAVISLLLGCARNTAIFIDNVQDCDQRIATSLLNIFSRTYAQDMRFCLILAFNTQTWIRGCAAESLLQKIASLSRQDAAHAHCCELADFDKKTFGEFVGAAISGTASFRETHAHLIDLWWEAIEPRPLHITQALLLACDKRLLRLDTRRGILTIDSPVEFAKNAVSAFISKELSDTLKQRWPLIVDLAWGKAKAKRTRAFKLITFCGKIATSVGYRLGITHADINDFADRGLVRYEAPLVTPFHRQTQRIFLFEVLKFDDFFEPSKRKFFRHFLKAAADIDGTQLEHQRFIAKYALGELDAEDMDRAWQLLRYPPVEPHEELFFEAAWDAVLRGNAPFASISARIAFLESVCERWRHRQPWEVGHQRFKEADNLVNALAAQQGGIDASMCAFKVAYANQMLVGHKDRDLLAQLIAADTTAGRLPPDSLSPEFRGRLANRLCVAYKSVGQYIPALASGRLAHRIARELGSAGRILKVRSLIDIGNIFQNGCHLTDINDMRHHGPSRVKTACWYWAKASDEFDRLTDCAPLEADFAPMVDLYRAQVALLDNDQAKCGRITERAIRHCTDHNVAFFGIKHMIVRAVSFLVAQTPELDNAQALASEAVHWADSAQVLRYLWTAYWLAAKVALGKRQPDAAEAYYQKAAQALDQVAEEEVKIYHYHFYDDLVIEGLGRRCGRVDAIELTQLGVPHALRTRYARVAELSRSAWQDLCATYLPTARFTAGRRNLPSP